jgi:hypothetical protein
VLQQVDRLHSLADDLRQNGNDVVSLSIIGPAQHMVYEREEMTHILDAAAQEMTHILDALAEAGQQPGGLPLEQLQLPVFGSCPVFYITPALSVCPRLHGLILLDSCSGQTTRASRQDLDQLAAALRQLRQLKTLVVQGGLFRYLGEPVGVLPADGIRVAGGVMGGWNLDNLLGSLPSSLECCVIDDYNQRHNHRWFSFHSSSMRHLVALQRLVLPNRTTVSTEVHHTGGMADPPAASSSSSSARGAAGGPCHHPTSSSSRGEVAADSPRMGVEPSHHNHLADLSAVTYLACGSALHPTGRRLLAFPNLVELRAGHADDVLLGFLAKKPSLRSLGCLLDYSRCFDQADALSALTQLTGLGLVLQQPHQVETYHAGAFQGAPPVQAGAAERLGAAVSTMTGLQKLRLEPDQLVLVEPSPLTALSSVDVLMQNPGDVVAQAKAQSHLRPLGDELRVAYPTWPGVGGHFLGPA